MESRPSVDSTDCPFDVMGRARRLLTTGANRQKIGDCTPKILAGSAHPLILLRAYCPVVVTEPPSDAVRLYVQEETWKDSPHIQMTSFSNMWMCTQYALIGGTTMTHLYSRRYT